MFRMAVALVLLPSFCFSSESSATGEISGRVLNQALGLFLEGARVELVGTNRAVLTDRDGHFRLAEVRAGATTLVVSYTGLNSQNVVLDVKSAQVVTRDIGLVSDIYVMDAFKVASLREVRRPRSRSNATLPT